jgi:hypothetical protein
MKKTTMISLLLLSTVAVTPAFANWFANPRTNTMLNVGSAPSPTPEDLRKIGDSRYASNAPVIIHEPPLASATPSTVVGEPVVLVPQMRAADVEYRPVIGVGGQRLGAIIAFDETMQQAELQLSTGVAVSMPATLFMMDHNGRMMAPTVSRGDVLAMAKTQTGRTVATNLVIRDRNTRA